MAIYANVARGSDAESVHRRVQELVDLLIAESDHRRVQSARRETKNRITAKNDCETNRNAQWLRNNAVMHTSV